MKAVIPAAGFGVRFLPLTKDQPKEMLPVVHKPTIQYVVEEAVAAGITDILVITGRGKRSLEDHFDRSLDLEMLLERQGRTAELDMVQKISNMADIHFIRQKVPRGLGDAIYLARRHVGNEPFVVMLGDNIHRSKVPVVKQLMDAHEQVGGSVISVEAVPPEKLKDYGNIKTKKVSDRLYQVLDLIEKPRPEEVMSNFGITGTYVLSPKIFECLERTAPGRGGEIQLTDALRYLNDAESIYGYVFEGMRYDVGDKPGWLKATFDLALADPELGPQLRPYVAELMKRYQ